MNLFKSLAARLTQMGGDENAPWLTVNEGPAGRHGSPCQRKEATGLPRGARRMTSASKTAETKWHRRGQVGPPGRTTCTEMPHRERPSEAARCGLPHHSQWLLRCGAQIPTRSDRSDTGNGEAHWLTWTHGGTQGCRTFHLTSQSWTRKIFTTLQRGEKDKKRLAAAQAERAKTNKHGKAKGGV